MYEKGGRGVNGLNWILWACRLQCVNLQILFLVSYFTRENTNISTTAIFSQQTHFHTRASWIRRPGGRPFPKKIYVT